ncbi:MAG: hypothetical protein AB7G47_20160 [Mycolicibacterium sp.]|uniref:hypothetical protein n=1 Tax=Mycolicibacterium sp. TaxID=2320850 RepID=UPI003D0C32B9
MTAPATREHRSHVWGIERGWVTMITAWLIAIAVATVPVTGALARVGVIAAGVLVLALGVVTWSGFTAVQWISRRIAIAWRGRGDA